jgi:hypothetical protein
MNIAETERQNDKEDVPFMEFEEEGQFSSAATALGLNGADKYFSSKLKENMFVLDIVLPHGQLG